MCRFCRGRRVVRSADSRRSTDTRLGAGDIEVSGAVSVTDPDMCQSFGSSNAGAWALDVATNPTNEALQFHFSSCWEHFEYNAIRVM